MASFNEEIDKEPRAFIVYIDDETSSDEQGDKWQALVVMKINQDPHTMKEALESNVAEQWKDVMMKEIETLKAKGTWELIPKPKDCRNVIQNK